MWLANIEGALYAEQLRSLLGYGSAERSHHSRGEPETVRHLLYECFELGRSRLEYMGVGTIGDLSDIADVKLRRLLKFANSKYWFV